MMDKEMMRNGSGYYDDTAYKGMTTSPKPGEIWTHNQSGAYMLVMANVNGVCPTLRLNEQEKEGCIPVECRAIMYTNPAFMGYVFETNLSQYVKSVKGDEMKAVKQKCAEVLGIKTAQEQYEELQISAADLLERDKEREAQHNTIIDLTKRNAELLVERDKLLEEIAGYGETIKRQADELQVSRREAVAMGNELRAAAIGAEKTKVYKELYESMMDRMMKLAMRGEA